jgi:hypothetical protein
MCGVAQSASWFVNTWCGWQAERLPYNGGLASELSIAGQTLRLPNPFDARNIQPVWDLRVVRFSRIRVSRFESK